MPPFTQNPIASQYALYSNPNPTSGMGGFQMPSVQAPMMQAPMTSGLYSLGSGNVGLGSIPGSDTGFDSSAYLRDLEKYTKGTDSGFGMNMPTFQLGLSGLMGLGNLYGAYQSNKLANKSFDYSKAMADKNYRNTVQSYNTALEDQRNVRGFMEGKSQAQIQSEIERNRLA
jgi:hypothetical protein